MQSPIPKALVSGDQQQPGEGEQEDGEIQEDYVDTRPAASEIAAVEQEIEDLYAGGDDDGASTRGRVNTMENKFKKMITSGPRVPAMRMRRTSSAKAGSSPVRSECFTVARPLLRCLCTLANYYYYFFLVPLSESFIS